MPQAPDDLKWNLSLRLALNGENVPGRVRERPVLSQSVLWTGDPKESRRCLDHALSICKPIEVTRRVLSFLALQTMLMPNFRMAGGITPSPVTSRLSTIAALTTWWRRWLA